jgi:hypothetical protein
MGAVNGRAATLLGQTQELVITDVVIAPQLFISLETTAGGLDLRGPCLRIIDALRGRAIFSPVSPQFARKLAADLLTYADEAQTVGGDHGIAAVQQ